MKHTLSQFVYLIIGLFVYLMITPTVWASGEFQADYNVQYAVAPSGSAIVTQNITLTNLQTNLYPEKYSIVLDTTKIKNVIAYDSHALVKTDITQDKGKTQILLTFNDKVVGIGKKINFTLRFENGDIAQKNGSIWEINIPGVKADTDIASYSVSLAVPDVFGPNAYMSPLPADGSKWTRDQMMAGGISAAYGVAQAFSIRLSYNITNPTITSSKATIAIPPDTAYQTVLIQSIDPHPDNIIRDTDGNWLAEYDLLPTQNKEIEVALYVAVELKPKVGYSDSIENPGTYLLKQKYWETDDPKIQALAKKYTTPRAIYDYVVGTLSYDYKRVNEAPIRKGALEALADPTSSICMEFTDLFIAIARAAGIPARESLGYAYTSNSKLRPLSLVADILHAWPEYYDTQADVWVAVDPTWANTTGGVNYFDKMDFNHITFALQGASSTGPFPAGFYRKQGKTTKDVAVTFSDYRALPVGKLVTTITFPSRVTAGIPSRGVLTLENTSGVSIPEAHVLVQSSPIDVAISGSPIHIPPLAKLTIPLTMTIPNYLQSGSGRFVVTVNGESKQFIFAIQPIFSYFIIPMICFAAMICIILLFAAYRMHLWKRFRKH